MFDTVAVYGSPRSLRVDPSVLRDDGGAGCGLAEYCSCCAVGKFCNPEPDADALEKDSISAGVMGNTCSREVPASWLDLLSARR